MYGGASHDGNSEKSLSRRKKPRSARGTKTPLLARSAPARTQCFLHFEAADRFDGLAFVTGLPPLPGHGVENQSVAARLPIPNSDIKLWTRRRPSRR